MTDPVPARVDANVKAGLLEAELERLRVHNNTVRLNAGFGYVTPDDVHEGRGEAIRKARREGMLQARTTRIASAQPDSYARVVSAIDNRTGPE